MLLKSVDVLNSRGSLLSLALANINNGYVVKNIEGLDPVTATFSSGSFANQDGEQYFNSRRQKRNIKITLGLQPNYATMDTKALRDQLYAYFMPKSSIDMTFKMFDRFAVSFLDQNLDLTISGRVESFESALFSKDPEVVISILNFNPDFEDKRLITIDATTVTNVDPDNPPGYSSIDYKGTTDTGVVLTWHPQIDLYPLDFVMQNPDGTLRTISIGPPIGGFHSGDVVVLSSVPGNKYVNLIRGSNTTSILYSRNDPSLNGWLTLQPGVTYYKAIYNGGGSFFKIEYTNKYGGL